MDSSDLNNDGIVDSRDLSILVSSWGTNGPAADINNDGTVNSSDLSVLVSHWGETNNQQPADFRQLIGMEYPWTCGASILEEGQRLATLFGAYWNQGAPVQRIFPQPTTKNPPEALLESIVAQGNVPWFSLKPGGGDPANDLNGSRDSYWIAWGDYLKTFYPAHIIFTYNHEHDRFRYSGTSNSRSNPGWVAYQETTRDAFVRIANLMRDADTTHGLSHVDMVPIWTGYAWNPVSGRDPGLSWHNDFNAIGSDPYDFWCFADGTRSTSYSFEHLTQWEYKFSYNPSDWYQDYHPFWPVPDQCQTGFPYRIMIGETGSQWDLDDLDFTNQNSNQPQWIRGLGESLRTTRQRYEVVCWWHNGWYPGATITPTSTSQHFAGGGGTNDSSCRPYYQASVDAWIEQIALSQHHTLPITKRV